MDPKDILEQCSPLCYSLTDRLKCNRFYLLLGGLVSVSFFLTGTVLSKTLSAMISNVYRGQDLHKGASYKDPSQYTQL